MSYIEEHFGHGAENRGKKVIAELKEKAKHKKKEMAKKMKGHKKERSYEKDETEMGGELK